MSEESFSQAPTSAPAPGPAEAEVAKETLFDFISTKMTGSAPAEVTEETLPSAPETKESEETVQAWTALLSRIPARWDGEPETSEEFKDVMRKGADGAGVAEKAKTFLRDLEAKDVTSRYKYLSVYNLVKGTAEAPKDLSAYVPMLYRFPLAAAAVNWFDYMNLDDSTIRDALSGWVDKGGAEQNPGRRGCALSKWRSLRLRQLTGSRSRWTGWVGAR